MIIVNDHVLLTAVIACAVGLYMIEVGFFWTRWSRLSTRMDQEGSAHSLIQELQAEVDVLAEEVAGLRRQLMRYNEADGGAPAPREAVMYPGPAPAPKRPYPPASSIPAPAAAPSSPAVRTPPSRQEAQQRPQERLQQRPQRPDAPHPSSHAQERSPSPRPQSMPPSSSSSGFSRGIEVLHRRVVELARTGMDSAAIATECQLSQTETELILSLNGIKRTS